MSNCTFEFRTIGRRASVGAICYGVSYASLVHASREGEEALRGTADAVDAEGKHCIASGCWASAHSLKRARTDRMRHLQHVATCWYGWHALAQSGAGFWTTSQHAKGKFAGCPVGACLAGHRAGKQ
eukprot:6489130-Amphidinium_carterae.2